MGKQVGLATISAEVLYLLHVNLHCRSDAHRFRAWASRWALATATVAICYVEACVSEEVVIIACMRALVLSGGACELRRALCDTWGGTD